MSITNIIENANDKISKELFLCKSFSEIKNMIVDSSLFGKYHFHCFFFQFLNEVFATILVELFLFNFGYFNRCYWTSGGKG